MGPATSTRSTPRVYRWQWTLANGGTVAAIIDPSGTTETILQGTTLLSQSGRGEKPDGHVVTVEPERDPNRSERPGMEAVITFAATAAVCILRVDGHEVAPTEWPVRPPPELPPPTRPYGTWALIGVAVVLLVTFGFFVRTTRGEPAHVDPKLDGTFRAPSGLFIAHYPDGFDTRAAILPPGAGGVVLTDATAATAIVLGALPNGSSATVDPWVLQQRLHDEAIVNLPKGAARYEPSSRRDETCLGRPGAVVTGRMILGAKTMARVWSCTFVHESTGYIALYMLAEPATSADERHARAIVDATELTHLADLGTPTGASPIEPLGSAPRLRLPR